MIPPNDTFEREGAIDPARSRPPARILLGLDHPLARAIDACRSAQRQCTVVAAIAVGSIRPAAEGHRWALALIVAAGVALVAFALLLAGQRCAVRERALELIARGQGSLALAPVQAQRRRLLRPRTRIAFARTLDGIVTQARRPRSRQLGPAPPLLDYGVVDTAGGELRAVADLLRRGRPGVQGLARVEWLLTHAESPLYGHEAPRLQADLRQVRRLLAGAPWPGPVPGLARRETKRFRTTTEEQPTGGDMSDSGMLGHADVEGLVLKARDHLAAGHDKEAARLLTDAAYHTHDPQLEQQVRELAEEGLQRAGRLSRGRWTEIIRIADLRAQHR
jgi:hypothetical protein